MDVAGVLCGRPAARALEEIVRFLNGGYSTWG